jgi:hypothetical protein
MKGDFTRTTFEPTKHYSAVRQQQGRVQLDADWNEQVDITAHRERELTGALVGNAGTSLNDNGFALTVQSTHNVYDLVIGQGSYYLGGILCENEVQVAYSAQPDFPGAPPLSSFTATGAYLAYLDTWPRTISVLENPELREVALGGPDTTIRSKTVWQVKLVKVDDSATSDNFVAGWVPPNPALTAGAWGQLAAQAAPPTQATGDDLVPPGAGYRRLENQLYRVEVYASGSVAAAGTASPPAAAPTFLWSRDNASVAARIIGIDTTTSVISIDAPGKDTALGFAAGQWVELTDDGRTLRGEPGVLVQLSAAQGTALSVTSWPTQGNTPMTLAQPGAVPTATQLGTGVLVRRWDAPGALPITAGQWIDLEDGVQVQFTTGDYRTGDYWLIPARSLTGDVDWPRDSKGPVSRPAQGINHAYGALALLTFDGAAWSVKSDCRRLFPALTQITTLAYVCGDGQQAVPDPTQPASLLLQEPLQVGVLNGQQPVSGVPVQFRILIGSGQLQGPGAATGSSVTVLTGADGIASCNWTLDATTLVQQVQAVLTSPGGTPLGVPVRFIATLSEARSVAYDPSSAPNLGDARTVQAALDALSQVAFDQGAIAINQVQATDPASNQTVTVSTGTAVTLAIFEKGLQIVCGEPVNPALIDQATCFVALDLPWNGTAPVTEASNTIVGYLPVILNGTPKADGSNTITWMPSSDATVAQAQHTLFAQVLAIAGQVLARLTLKGNFVWLGGGVQTGATRRGGDFELHFWLVTGISLGPLSLSDFTVRADTPVQLTVSLTGPAPAGGAVVNLSSTSGDVPVPATVSISAGNTQALVTITVGEHIAQPSATITATYAGATKTASLTAAPPLLQAVTLTPGDIMGGQTVAGTVTLSQAVQSDTQIALSTGNAAVASVQPTSVTIPANTTSAPFTLTTQAVAADTAVAIIARHSNSLMPDAFTRQVELTVHSAGLLPLVLTPASVNGGPSGSVQGAVTVSQPAPAGGLSVALASSSQVIAGVPGSVAIPAGGTSATFTVTTQPVAVAQQVTITATLGANSVTALLAVNPPALASLQLNTSSILGGGTVAGTVSLTGAAPAGGMSVVVTSSNTNVASVDVSPVQVPAGAASAGVSVSTNEVSVATQVVIAVTLNGISKTFGLTVRAPVKQPRPVEKLPHQLEKISRIAENLQFQRAELPQVVPTSVPGEVGPVDTAGAGRAFISAAERPSAEPPVADQPPA